jgi:hypothetical protein
MFFHRVYGNDVHPHRNPPKGRKRPISGPDPRDYEDPEEYKHDFEQHLVKLEAEEDERRGR